MDESESTHRLNAGQGAPRVFQRRDGGWMVAYDEDGVTRIGRLILVPDRTELGRFKDALQRARDELEGAVSDVAHQGLLIDERLTLSQSLSLASTTSSFALSRRCCHERVVLARRSRSCGSDRQGAQRPQARLGLG
jgi:hypothetical protein